MIVLTTVLSDTSTATTLTVALIVAIPAVIASTVAPLLLGRQARREREAKEARDNARQDVVAARVAEAVKAAEGFRVEANAKLTDLAVVARETHILVNSDMTAARESELKQTEVTLVMMRKLVAIDVAAGRQPTDEDLAAIEATVARIAELRAILADRRAQQQQVEDEAEQRGPDPA